MASDKTGFIKGSRTIQMRETWIHETTKKKKTWVFKYRSMHNEEIGYVGKKRDVQVPALGLSKITEVKILKNL